MNLKGLMNAKLVVVLRKKKHVRYMICAENINSIGSSLYNLALLTLASKQIYSTLAISLANVLSYLPSLINPVLAYLTDRETRRLKKAALLNWIQVLIYFMIAFLMLQYQMPLALFMFILLANVVSDIFDAYISDMFIPFSKTWVAPNEQRIVTSFEIILSSLSVVIGQLIGVSWLTWFPNSFFGLSLLNALTFALGLFFLKKIKFDDTVKNAMSAGDHFSLKDFFTKMKSAYLHMHDCHVLQTMWLLAFAKGTFASYRLILNVAMVSASNLRFGSYAQTLVVLQINSFIGLVVGSFLRFNWLEKLSYGRILFLTAVALTMATLTCFLNGPLIVVLLLLLIGTILSGYMAPKYYTDFIQKIDEEQLTRVESLNNFILLLSGPVGSLQAMICLQLFSLKTSWLLELGMLLIFLASVEVVIYQNKRHSVE